MRNRGLVSVALVLPAVVIALSITAGCIGSDAKSEAATGWTAPRTPQPGLYAGDPDGSARGTGPGFLNDTSDRTLSKGRSLVVDPPDGRVPIMPWAEER